MDQLQLKSFTSRIRRALAWKLGAIGLFFGALVSLALAGADVFRWLWVEWPLLLIAPAVGALSGVIFGFTRRITREQVAASIDRRAGLRDRMATSLELDAQEHPFAAEVHADAADTLKHVDPKKLYPVGLNRWHSLAGVTAALTVGLVLLGNTPLFDSPETRRDKEEMKKQAEEVVKVVKPALEDPNLAKPSEEYAKALQKYARELERARMEKKEALKRAHELADKGQDVKKELSNRLNKNLDSAQKSLQEMLAEQLQKNGEQASPEQLRQQIENLLNPSDSNYSQALQEYSQRRDEISSARNDLESRMDDLRRQLQQPGLSPQDEKALQEALKDLQSQLRDLNKQSEELSKQMSEFDKNFRDQLGSKLDEEMQKEMANLQKEMAELMKKLKMPGLTDAQKKEIEKRMKELQELMKQLEMGDLQKGIQELMNDPQMKQIIQRMAELMKKAKFVQGENGQGGEPEQAPKLTKEDIEELQKAIDEMAEKLKDSDFRKKLLADLKAALDNMKELMLQMNMGAGFCLGMGILPGLPMPIGSPSHGGAFSGSQWVPKFDKGVKGEGKTLPSRVTGERHPTLGRETFVEVKGPAKLGGPSRVPYLKVLPKYRQAAEEALRKQKIAKDQEKRVREYFRSIGGQ